VNIYYHVFAFVNVYENCDIRIAESRRKKSRFRMFVFASIENIVVNCFDLPVHYLKIKFMRQREIDAVKLYRCSPIVHILATE